jgi:hypothetical protein
MLLIITSCIKVNNKIPFLTVKNENDRLNQYIETLVWAFTNTPFDKIIYCDNSGISLDELKNKLSITQKLSKQTGKRFELLGFQGNLKQVYLKGKGYGEGEIIDYVYKNSQLLKSETVYYKITGRLTINNILTLIKNKQTENIFLFRANAKYVDTRFYCLKISDYKKYFRNVYKLTNDSNGYYLEHVYYDTLNNNKISYRRFLAEIEFRGISGSTGEIYNTLNTTHWLKSFIFSSPLYTTYIGRLLTNIIVTIFKKQKF